MRRNLPKWQPRKIDIAGMLGVVLLIALMVTITATHLQEISDNARAKATTKEEFLSDIETSNETLFFDAEISYLGTEGGSHKYRLIVDTDVWKTSEIIAIPHQIDPGTVIMEVTKYVITHNDTMLATNYYIDIPEIMFTDPSDVDMKTWVETITDDTYRAYIDGLPQSNVVDVFLQVVVGIVLIVCCIGFLIWYPHRCRMDADMKARHVIYFDWW